MKKEGKIRISILIFIYTIHFAYLKVYTEFKNVLAPKGAEKSVTDFLLERKKNEQIKGLISNIELFLLHSYTINSSLSSFAPNFRILTLVVAEKSLTEKKSISII